MRADGEAIRDFMAQKRIALVGLSRQEKAFSRAVLHELVAHGYDVVPVNPSGGEIEGRHVYARVVDIDDDVDGALVMTPASDSAAVVRDCAKAGVRRVWLHQGIGNGSVSDEAVMAGEEAGLSVVAGACPLMFFENPGLVHKVHRFGMKVAGTFPAEAVVPDPVPAVVKTTRPGRGLPFGMALLQGVVALGAIPAGVALLQDPTGHGIGLTVGLLARSPFADFWWPGLFLLLVNGVATLLGAVLSVARRRPAGEVAVVAGGLLVVWMVAQFMWIGLLSPLQPLLLWAGLAEAGFGMALRENLSRPRGAA